MLIHIKDLFPNGGKDVVGKFAYPAFNTINLETTLGIIEAGEELGVPLILQVSEGSIKYAGGLLPMYEMMATLASHAKVPVALHMDHGKDVEQLKAGIELGFSSVMIDHSHEDLEVNIRDTKELVEFAHKEGAWVQGEVGRIGGGEDWQVVAKNRELLTSPEDALRFVGETGVDTLAGAFGTIHGIVKMQGEVKPQVDTARIRAVYEAVKIPLVLHGASGVEKEVVVQAISAGVAIINIDTELRFAFASALRRSVSDQPAEVDPRVLMKPVIEAVKQTAERKLQEFGTQGL